jgi:hypothetical protein
MVEKGEATDRKTVATIGLMVSEAPKHTAEQSSECRCETYEIAIGTERFETRDAGGDAPVASLHSQVTVFFFQLHFPGSGNLGASIISTGRRPGH